MTSRDEDRSEREVSSTFDIDVFTNPFPYEKGFAIYKRGGIRLLVIKLEAFGKYIGESM